MKVLVTGGAGYIGSHTCVELMQRGHEVEIADNFCNSSPRVLDHIAQLVGVSPALHLLDIRSAELHELLRSGGFDAVIHFAALKSVAESVARPLEYFDTNVGGTLNLLRGMRNVGVNHMVFSSSATVYGPAKSCPIREDAPLGVVNPYGRTKLVMEEMIGDLCAADPLFRAAVLRYFNPVGAHPSGMLGEHPSGVPNNLMPYICQVAIGTRAELRVFGSDYPTPDGTGVRDYIHVVDLAKAHVDALDHLARGCPSLTVNLGTGRGYSVLEVARTFERVSGRSIPLTFMPRREGDVAECYADTKLARELLGWEAALDLERMCADAWRWQSRFPRGFTPSQS